MPGYKTHIYGGILFGGAFLGGIVVQGFYTLKPVNAAAMLVISVLGAMFPDTDTDSKGQNFFYFCLAALDLVLMILGLFKWAAIVGFFAMLPAIGHHRGWTHTWPAMLFVPLPIIILPVIFYDISPGRLFPYYLAAVSGYFSHLLLDRIF